MKCFCPTCSQQRNESNTNLKGRHDSEYLYSTVLQDLSNSTSQISKRPNPTLFYFEHYQEVIYTVVTVGKLELIEFVDASFRQDKKNKMDLRDRGQLYHSNFFNVKTKTSKVKNPGTHYCI